MCNAQVKSESPDAGNVFSPETAALIKGLSDSPESMQLKAEILRSANELKRGPLLAWADSISNLFDKQFMQNIRALNDIFQAYLKSPSS